MALNKKVFYIRTTTALVFAFIMLCGLFLNEYSFLLLFGIIFCGCLYEFFKIIKKISPVNYMYYLPLSLIYIVLPVMMIIHLGITITVSTIGYESLQLIYSPLLPCAIIFSIWINDTMAYLVGSMIGKTPFSRISPKKTWEGTIGGAILCIIVIWLLSRVIPQASAIDQIHWIIIPLICAVFGTVGDLIESKLKRMAAIKDSGYFMPGHGGFLDRFDSLLVATPFVWLYAWLFI